MTTFNWGMRALGISLLSAAAVMALPVPTTFMSLHSFNGTDGQLPNAGLVQAMDGNLYGTTVLGGPNHDSGAVFKITPSGTLTTVYNFCSMSGCTDGQYPNGLVQATNGEFYGTTESGGANGYGSVFSLTASGTLTTLYSFCATGNPCPDGDEPEAGLVQGANGEFYGTTDQGGAHNQGTVFSVTAGGTLITLHSFAGYPTDGANPEAGLVEGTNGDFYGTTDSGGANCQCGTVFKITSSGALTILHSFDGTDGDEPEAGLIQGANGKFYGTTYAGGAGGADADGTVFSITASGTLRTLHNFAGYPTDGNGPTGTLIQATNGDFYGTTQGGGASSACGDLPYDGCGTVFRITAGGTVGILHSFDVTDGQAPVAGLVQDTSGHFYGTTGEGGANLFGTVFTLSVGLGPFVVVQPTSGAVGTAVTILGNNLTSPCIVTFYNNISAGCTWVSSSEITTTVPAGATTGIVQVATTGSGMLSSNVPFRVTP